jgi:hypothetical protein
VIRFAFDVAGFILSAGVGFILGLAVRARRDRARADRQRWLDELIGWDDHVDQALQPWREP